MRELSKCVSGAGHCCIKQHCVSAQCALREVVRSSAVTGTLPMPPSDSGTQMTQPGKRRQEESLWGTALRQRIVRPQVTDHIPWTHCRYKAVDKVISQKKPPRNVSPPPPP